MKKLLSVFLSFCILVSCMVGFSVTAGARGGEWSKFTAGVTTLGTSGISAPLAPAQYTDAWKGSYVYYGQYNNQPVKYRVLAPNTSVFGGTTMLLDCDSILEKVRFDNDGNANEGATAANEWAHSDLKT